MKELIKELYGKFFFIIFKLFPLKNKVVFCSFWGENCSDNPKYISEELLKEKSNIKQVWIIRKNTKIEKNSNIKYVNWGSLSMIYELATAKVWVDNHTKPVWISKRKNQFYIETWHGGLGMKKIEADLGKNLKPKSKKQIMHNSYMADLFISNSNFLTQIYKRAFWYKGEILECGFPKNDIFFAEKEKLDNVKNKVYKFFNIPDNNSIVLYAPTYRKDFSLDYYDIQFNKLIKTLNEKFHKDFICMVRLHPRMKNMFENMHINNEQVIDGSKYNDIQELIIASEVFITDYSSGIFDFALQFKPGFIYAKDIKKYKNERGLYFELETLPFPLSTTNKELEENIEKFDYEKYKQKLYKYFNLKEVGLKEKGNASKKVVEIILQYIS